MNINVVGINYHPEPIGISVYTTEMCEYLKSAGHEVTVFTAFPYYPQWSVAPEYRGKIFLRENINGIEVKRSYVYVPSIVTAASRALHEISFMISSFVNLLFSSRADVMIAVSPTLGTALVAAVIGFIKRTPFILHIQDLQPDAATALGMLKKGALLDMLYKAERFAYARAARVSAISGKMCDRIAAKGVPTEKIFLFPNWIDAEHVKPAPKDNEFASKHNPSGKFLALYSGNIGIKQGLDVIVEAARILKDDRDILFIVAGDGAYKKTLLEKHKALHLENIVFLDVRPSEELPLMLSAADICLIPQRQSVTDIVMPSKLLAIMACERPAVATAPAGSELYDVIAAAKCGITVEPGDGRGVAAAINTFHKDKSFAERCGKSGRAYATKHFAKTAVLSKFEELLSKCPRR
ncbi:MAG: WcaI family glycosyltransferase [Endomicrobiia bacterium]|nr:WcaI family glycosyltransferase [Endomicrobiia bacterium]